MPFTHCPFLRFPAQVSRLPIIAWMLVSSLTVSAIYGCATPYEPEGILGGYRDSSIGNDQFHITIQGNGYTNTGMVEQYFYRRAAEISKENSYAGYNVITFKTSMEPWGGMCCFPVATGVIQGLKEADKGVVVSKNVGSAPQSENRQRIEIKVSPVIMPPGLPVGAKRLAVIPLSELSTPIIGSWIDLAMNFLRTRHPDLVLVERETLAPIVEEAVVQHSGRVDDNQSVRVGRLAGADSLLTYRVDHLALEQETALSRSGGIVSGSVEFRLLQVETGLALFRQQVTATAFLPNPGPANIWPLEYVKMVYRATLEDATAYALAALVASFGDNPLGIVPDLSASGVGVATLGTLQGSPSHVAGLKKGDRLLTVGSKQIAAWTEAIQLPATLTIERDGRQEKLQFNRGAP